MGIHDELHGYDPVDWLPHAASLMGIPYLKAVPTTDVNITFSLAIGVFLLIIFYNIKGQRCVWVC